LQCVAVRCSALQCVAVRCSVLRSSELGGQIVKRDTFLSLLTGLVFKQVYRANPRILSVVVVFCCSMRGANRTCTHAVVCMQAQAGSCSVLLQCDVELCCCSVLQCDAVCDFRVCWVPGRVLQGVAEVCCSVLQCVAVCCSDCSVL